MRALLETGKGREGGEPDPRYRVWHEPEQAQFEELLAVLISSGNGNRGVLEVSRDLARLAGSEAGLFDLDADAIAGIKGLGRARVAVILAAVELGRRKANNRIAIGKRLEPTELGRWLLDRMQGFANEHLYLFTYNRAFRLIRRHLLSRGNSDSVRVYYREIARLLLRDRATNAVIAHNHPGGSCAPSRADLESMRRLSGMLDPMGIRVLDQYIVGVDGVHSCTMQKRILDARGKPCSSY